MPARVTIDRVSVEFRGSLLRGTGSVLALQEVSLELRSGETLGVVGESGSGKTTLGQVLVGLQEPSGGKVVTTPPRKNSRRGDRQLVGQNPRWALNPRLRIWRSVAEPLAIVGVGRRKRRTAALEALSAVGLDSSFAVRYPHQLSGGQLQRAAIARALIGGPDLVVFDEAVSALDVSIQVQTINIIKDLQQRLGFAALFISHDLPAVRYAADRVAVLYRGQLVHEAPVGAFYERPLHPYALAIQHTGSGNTSYQLKDELIPDAPGAAAVGCVFASRCPFAIAVCALRQPELRWVESQRTACHRAEELDDAASPADLIETESRSR